MKHSRWFSKWSILPAVAVTMIAALVVGGSAALFTDTETSNDSTFAAWTSTQWTQTSQAEFEAGVLNNVDTTSSPGDVMLTLTSNVTTRSPTTNTGSAWTNPANANADGGGAATITSGAPSGNNVWGNYGFSLTDALITQVRVRYDAWSVGDATGANQQRVPTADADVSGIWQIAQTRISTGTGVNVGTWTASAGNLYDVAAEVIWTGNDDTDWINGTTDAGTNYQLFTFSSFTVPAGSTVVSVGVYERTSDVGAAGANEVAGAIRVNGVNYRAGTRNPPANGSQTWSSTAVWTTNPNTAVAWTVADVNGTSAAPLQQFGVSSIDGNPDIKVYSVFVIVIYTSSEYLAIDETTPDDTDFTIGVTDAGGYDYFTTTAFSVPTGATITNLTLYYRAVDAASAAGANVIRGAIKVNGVLYGTTATSNNPAITWTNYSYAFTTNPNTGSAWTVADINGTGANPLQQIGVNSTDLAPDVGVSMLYAEVNYTTQTNFEQIRVDVSWDGGTSWSSKATTTTTGTEATYWYDVTGATAWTPAKLADGQLRVRVDAQTVGTASIVSLDWLPVEVSYVESSGTIASQVLTTVTGSRWDALFWDESLATGTDITFEVRASDTPFLKTDASPSWTLVGGTSPVLTGLTSGQYKQWRATLTTSDASNTPTLQEARVYYYGG